MKIQFKILLATCAAAILLITNFSCKKEAEAPKETSMLTVQTVLGDVTIQSGEETVTPSTGYAIKENSVIKTGKLSILDIRYKNSGIIRINENSSINIARLIASENADDTLLKMDEGKVFVTVSKLMKDSTLQVKTTTSVAAVRGTSFRVSSEKGVSRVDVLKGRVKVNPVQDDVVIEKVETFVEPDKSVKIDQKDIVQIVEQKKEMKIVTLPKEEIELIKEEAKLVKIDDTFNEEIKTEIKEIGIETRPAEEIKDDKEYKEELTKHLETIQFQKEAEEKELRAKKAVEEEELRQEQKRKEGQIKADKAERTEKLRLQKLEQETKEKARIAAEEEKQRQLKTEEKKKEESRVKNIPNF